MQKIKIGVMDEEKEYVTSLITYLQKYSKGKWDLCAFTNVQALENHLDKRLLDILVGTDRRILERRCEKKAEVGLWLSDQKCDYREESDKLYVIYRFQSACEIGRCIERIIQNERKSVDEEKAIVAIYSPVGRCGKTTMALDIAGSGRYGKWLYMGLEDYSSFENGNNETTVGMDEALYYWKERREDKLLQIMECADNVLATGTSFMDGKQIDAGDIRWIRSLLLKSRYKGIVLDIGSGILQDLQLFQEFDKVVVPYMAEKRALVKKRNFERLMDLQEMDKNLLYFVDMDKEILKVKKEVFGGMDY